MSKELSGPSPCSSPPLAGRAVKFSKTVVRNRQRNSPPGPEGIQGWSMKTLKTVPNISFFCKLGDRPPLPLPVHEGNLSRYVEQNVTALPTSGGEGT